MNPKRDKTGEGKKLPGSPRGGAEADRARLRIARAVDRYGLLVRKRGVWVDSPKDKEEKPTSK